MQELAAARERLDTGRQARVPRWEEDQLRRDLVAALQAYADAIEAAGAPLPARLRTELELNRDVGRRR